MTTAVDYSLEDVKDFRRIGIGNVTVGPVTFPEGLK